MTSHKRPKLVTALCLGVLILAILQLARFFLSMALPPLPLTVPPLYLSLTGALWGLGALWAAWGLLIGRKWAPTFARWGLGAFALWYWADRLLLVRSDYSRQSIPASLFLTIVFLTAAYWILRRPKTRRYFREEME